VTNTGTDPMKLNAIGLRGSFTVSGACNGASTTTTATATESGDSDHQSHDQCGPRDHQVEIAFAPVVPITTTTTTTSTGSTTTTSSTTTTTSNSCSSLTLQQLNGEFKDDHDGVLTLAPGQCVNLTFSGTITFGDSSITLVPTTASGQTYQVQIIASNGASLQLDCTLPLGTGSCKVDQNSD
jgi:hypothetical protein